MKTNKHILKVHLILLLAIFTISNLYAAQPVFKWLSGAGGPGDDFAQSIVCDNNGNTYVTGYFKGLNYQIGSTLLTHGYSGDARFYLAKYDSIGNVLWAFTSARNEFAYGLTSALDRDGNILVGGHFSGSTLTFGSIVLYNPDYYGKMYLAKFDPNGKVIWAKTTSNSYYSSSLYGVAVDSKNNIYVTGHFQDQMFTFCGKSLANATPGTQDVFLYKLDSNGNALWATMLGGTSHDVGTALTVDKDNSIFVTGSFKSSAMLAGGSLILNTGSNGSKDVFVSKFDENGNFKWTNKFGGIEEDDAHSIDCDSHGNVYLCGNYISSTMNFNNLNLSKNNSSSNSGYLAKINTNGVVQWVAGTTNTSNNSSINGVDVNTRDEILVTGYYSGASTKFGTIELTNSASGYNEMFYAKYDTTGIAKNAKSIVGFGNDYGKAIKTDYKNNIYIYGLFSGSYIATDNAYANNTSLGYYDNVYLKYSDNINTANTNPSFDDIIVYPNPFKSEFNIKSNQYLSNNSLKISLINALGQEVRFSKEETSSGYRIVGVDKPGVYNLVISVDGNIIKSSTLISK